MINSLSLENWRTHKHTDLSFGKGTNVIIGVMGSGKSSIVNAISYSLFGTFPALKAKQVSLKETVMNKPNQQSVAQTRLEFDIGEKNYSVERIIKIDGTNEAKLYERRQLIAGPKQKDVNEKVELLLGLNYELFSRAVYAEQNEMDFFLKLNPSERKKKFDELLELEKYESARKNSVTLQNELAKENKQRAEFIQQQKNTVGSREEEKALHEIHGEREEIKTLEKTLKESSKMLQEKTAELKNLEEKEQKNQKLEAELLRNKSVREALEKEVETGEKLDTKKLEAELKDAKKTAQEKKKEAEELDKAYAKISGGLAAAAAEIKVSEFEKTKLENEKQGVGKLKGKCPTCSQELTEEHKKELIQEIDEKVVTISKRTKEVLERKEKLEKNLAETEKTRRLAAKELDEATRNIYKMESELKQSFQIEDKKKTISQLQKEAPQIQKSIEELGFDKKTLGKAAEEMYAARANERISLERIKEKNKLVKSLEETVEKIRIIKKNIAEAENSLGKAEKAISELGIFSNSLIATQTELRQAMLENINSAMTIIWQAVYPYKDYLDARLWVAAEGYDLQVLTRNKEWVRVEGILSGGERSAAALCIRMAFALVLTKKLSMLILDEPTHNLDSNAVRKLSGMLREEMPKLVEQIFVITHDKQLESAACGSIYQLSRNKDADEATQTETIQT